jgi:cell division septation protein DedD
MIKPRKMSALTVTAALAFCADPALEAEYGIRLLSEANAIVGAPLTPVSVAGVARRTAYRTAAATTTAAASQSSAQAATAQQQSATAQQQSATAQQQAATAQQQTAAAQQAQVAASQPSPTASGQALPIGTVVAALPAGCTQTTSVGVQYSKCGANYYRAAFQGNNLVYVTAQP